MGDIVLTSPVIRSITNQLNAVIHVLTKPAFADFYSQHPNVVKVYEHHVQGGIIDALRKEKYDLVIDLHNNLRSRFYTLRLGKPVRRFFKANLQKWLTVQLHNSKYLPESHLVHRYFYSLQKDGLKYDNLGLDFYFQKDFTGGKGADIITQLSNGGFVLLALGGTYATKRIPYELAKALIHKTSYRFVLVGGSDCAEIANTLTNDFPDQVTDTTAQLNIFESAWLAKHAGIVISGDSVMMHITAALKKPLIAIWGNTIPEFGMYPLYPSDMDICYNFEVPKLSCRPCSKLGKDKCPKGHFNCMMHQDVNAIIPAIDRFFKN